jgi:hypothetical protein
MDTKMARLLLKGCEDIRTKLIALEDLAYEHCEPLEFETIQCELDRAWTIIEGNLYPYIEFECPRFSRKRHAKKNRARITS